jgi:hypothetical protein
MGRPLGSQTLEENVTVTAERIAYLDQFDNDALASMCHPDGYYNWFKGEAEFAELDELQAVFVHRRERDAKWEAELERFEETCYPTEAGIEPKHPGSLATDEETCAYWHSLDNFWNTEIGSVLHHDSRCETHGTMWSN